MFANDVFFSADKLEQFRRGTKLLRIALFENGSEAGVLLENESDQVEKTNILNDWNALTDRQRNCLRALRELNALDADSRQGAENIASKAEGADAKANGFKTPLADLALRGLIASKRGRKGGCWITREGCNLLSAFDHT